MSLAGIQILVLSSVVLSQSKIENGEAALSEQSESKGLKSLCHCEERSDEAITFWILRFGYLNPSALLGTGLFRISNFELRIFLAESRVTNH